MVRRWRRDLAAGAGAGLLGGLVLLGPFHVRGMMADAESLAAFPAPWNSASLQLGLAAVLGATFGALFRYQPYSGATSLSGGLLFGLLCWMAGPLTFGPLLSGRAPTWSLDAAADAFPILVALLLYGAVLGSAFHALAQALARGSPDGAAGGPAPPVRHVAILGGGFGGVSAAQRLEQLLTHDQTVAITLVSQSNYLLFTPMLAEVASSGLEAQHISAPVRAALTRTQFRRAEVLGIDPASRAVRLRATPSAPIETLRYDHLILALGSVPNYHGLPGLEANAFALKALDDATRLRNHVIALLERADAESDPEERRRQLTFVVAGGGFAGVEMIAELRDLAHSVRRFYRRIRPEDLTFILVHSGARTLPELTPGLAAYAQRRLEARGIEFRLNTRVAGATPEAVLLSGGASIPTRTLVWTAGNQPNPLLKTLGSEHNKAGAVIVDAYLRVGGLEHVWAVGDCAQVPDLSGEHVSCPPTAQHAIRQAASVAQNLVAVLRGRPPKPFRFRTLAVLVALGHHTAVAEVRGWKFSGFLAWLMWRTVYLGKLPGFEKKARVALDWALDFVFPRDIALTTAAEATPDARMQGPAAGAIAPGTPARTPSDAEPAADGNG